MLAFAVLPLHPASWVRQMKTIAIAITTGLAPVAMEVLHIRFLCLLMVLLVVVHASIIAVTSRFF
jgi:hypothetical protein